MAIIRGTQLSDNSAYGNSELYGTNSNDTIYGYPASGAGSDYNDYDGYDRLYGFGGDDVLYGGNQGDTLYGGEGNDILYGGLNPTYSGDDYLAGGTGNDWLYGGTGNDTLYGESGNDFLYGEAGLDYLSGGDDNDYMSGGDGNDTLTGGSGSDTIIGGYGNDVLTSGTGFNKFKFNNKYEGLDTITDFGSYSDDINVVQSGFKVKGFFFGDVNLSLGTIGASQFRLGSRALDSNDYFVYNRSTGALYFDRDGSGSSAQLQIATLSNKASMSYSDIAVVAG
ncbi:MAG: calcium-binding protein [Oscillatoriophycideae cyanobacterium NC_groundwater_1537_Pr4_S-0.65um_50_18]|nr:calcium-binding protein [Oscillatoriophycideae cyanobacterium NC_groundwater_1537_Pr4_S-0.65um_50_18]